MTGEETVSLVDPLDFLYIDSIGEDTVVEPVFPFRIKVMPWSGPPAHWTMKMLEEGLKYVTKGDHIKAYNRLQRAADSEVKEVIAQLGGVQCTQPGCWRCCRALIQVRSKAEIDGIEEAMRALDGEMWGAVKKKAMAAKEVLDDLWSDESGVPGHIAAKRVATRFVSMGETCPMLIDGRCAIYENRPVACRTFSAPSICPYDDHGAVFLMVNTSSLCAQVAARSGARQTTIVDVILRASRIWTP